MDIKALGKALKNRISGKVTYTKPREAKQIQIGVIPKRQDKQRPAPSFKQYGDKGYVPSNGKGVGP